MIQTLRSAFQTLFQVSLIDQLDKLKPRMLCSVVQEMKRTLRSRGTQPLLSAQDRCHLLSRIFAPLMLAFFKYTYNCAIDF